MRATTRVPEPPVAPITNGGELATRTLATINAAEQYPRCRVFTSMNNRAIVFFAWGTKHVGVVTSCIRESKLPAAADLVDDRFRNSRRKISTRCENRSI